MLLCCCCCCCCGSGSLAGFSTTDSLLDTIVLCRPPVDICGEFEVEKTELPADVEYAPEARACCCILIVMAGACEVTVNDEATASCTPCAQGHVFFIAAGTSMSVRALAEGAVYYEAHVNMQRL